jgi:hypothetical protein
MAKAPSVLKKTLAGTRPVSVAATNTSKSRSAKENTAPQSQARFASSTKVAAKLSTKRTLASAMPRQMSQSGTSSSNDAEMAKLRSTIAKHQGLSIYF